MITAQQIFDNFVEENGRIPSFEYVKEGENNNERFN